MLPGSHASPINDVVAESLRNPRQLADAFSEFISASSLLESSYRELQQEVSHLGVQLAERNVALTRSLAENEGMRSALQQMIDSMPCGVLVLDSAGTIVTINPEWRRLLDLGGAPVKTLHDLSALSPFNFQAFMAEAEDDLDREICLPSSAGKRWLAIGTRKLSWASTGHAAGRRAPLESIWILRDITLAKLAEQEREAARSAMALAEVSTILAHEIRNPLASMELFAGLIAEDGDASGQWISHLRAGIRQLSGTVNNVLSIHCGTTPHLTPVNLTACVQGGVEFVRPIADQAGVALTAPTEDAGLMIQGNENLLRQIVLNLICNAIRHTPAGGKIDVTTRVLGKSRAQVEVADTGCGIPAALHEQIFAAGFSANGDSPGLGLAVCKRLMVPHRGEIRVATNAHGGSTFQLEFPTL